MNGSELSKITKETVLPLGLVIGISGGVLIFQSWISGQFGAVEDAVRKSQSRTADQIRELERKVDDNTRASRDRVTRDQFKLWAQELRLSNPTLSIPDPWTFAK